MLVPGWKFVDPVNGAQPPSIQTKLTVKRNVSGEIKRNQNLRVIGTYSNIGNPNGANNAGAVDVYITRIGVPDIRIAFLDLASNKIVPVPGKEEEFKQYLGPESGNGPNFADAVRKSSTQAVSQAAANGFTSGERQRDVAALIATGNDSYGSYFNKPNNGTGGAGADSTKSNEPGAEPRTEIGANPEPESTDIEQQPLTLKPKENIFNESLNVKEILKYPEKINEGSDYLKIRCFEYIPGGFEGINVKDSSSRFDTSDDAKNEIGTVYLPIQSASEGNSVDWGNGDNLNAIQIAGLSPAINAISNASTGNIIGAGQQFIRDIAGNIRALGGEIDDNDILTYFGGQAIGSNVFTRATGQVLNNNLELLYNGTSLRSFVYNYRFTPRSDTESKMVRRIIKFFKRQMSAKKSSLFLGTPNVFKLEYIYGKTQGLHPYLNQIKICALVGFNVNYIPDNSYMTYQDGGMTSYQVSMAFTEINPIYDTDNLNNIDDETTGY